MEPVDYSVHRMTDFSWYDEYEKKLGRYILTKFKDMVYAWMMEIKPGDVFDIRQKKVITPKNRDLFIKTVCMFISEGNDDYLFSDDFTRITRIDRNEIKSIYERIENKRRDKEQRKDAQK